jgi:simple sugar transport system permease protein
VSVSTGTPPTTPVATPLDEAERLGLAARLGAFLASGGVAAPIITTILGFLAAGLVVLATGHDPLSTYKAIFEGAGLDWLLPWNDADRAAAAINLQQTLVTAAPLILTGLAVALAFRSGVFNIGGQGQYLMGAYAAVVVGAASLGVAGWLHIALAVAAAAVAGAIWSGIAGVLKATVGADEVITTIMLDYVAIWIGAWAVGVGGPLQDPAQPTVPISKDVASSAHLPVIWGDPLLQGLHLGILVALAALVVYWLVVTRTRTGFEVRAIGFNPEAARYAGMPVARTYIKVMAVCGAFAGLAGAMDILGWQFRLTTDDISASQIGFLGIAVALLGRNTSVGILLSALLFGALSNGTSVRHLDPTVFPPELASGLTYIIQGLIVLLVSADMAVVFVLRRMRRRRRVAA